MILIAKLLHLLQRLKWILFRTLKKVAFNFIMTDGNTEEKE